MKASTSIREAYWETEKHFINLIDTSMTSGDKSGYLKFKETSKINENAYFVLFWGQFEAFVNNKVTEIENSALDMSFMSRLRLAISPNHEYYEEIDKYYAWRCKLAHGKVAKLQSVVLASVFDKIDEIVEKVDNSFLPLGEDNLFDFFSDGV